MALRPRRGKYMPIEVPPEVVDSDSSSASEVSSKNSMGRTAFVTGKPPVVGKKVRIEESSDEYDDHDRCSEFSGMEDDEDDLLPPPTPRITKDGSIPPSQSLDPQDYERMYTELIDNCKSLEGVTRLDESFQDDLSKNIKKGKALFESLMKGSVTETYKANRRKKGGAVEMYLAFLHTKITSNIVRNRAECIGTGPAIFSVEEFLSQMRKEYVDGSGTYSPHLASANIAKESSAFAKTLYPLVAMIGTFDRNAPIIPRVIKTRTPRAKLVEPPEGADDGDSQDAVAPVETSNPVNDDVAKDINKIIKAHYRQLTDPLNFYEFVLDRSSFSRTVENIFHTSFLVKDGHVSLNKDEPGKLKDLALSIQPEVPVARNDPRNDDESRNQLHRQKHIMSFSPRLWKNLCEMSQGEDIIKNYMALMAADPNALPD